MTTLHDAYDVRITRVSGDLSSPDSTSYMSRKQCEDWAKKHAWPGDRVEIVAFVGGG